jgi:Holliday junction resolvase RusA-like endonuclease
MAEYKLIIPHILPGLNEYQFACRSHFSKGAKMKKSAIQIVSAYIYQQLREVKIENKVRIDYAWYEKNKKRDLDNISSFGRKVIQDALVDNGVIENDGWNNVVGFSDTFYIDSENPRIEVVITEIIL